MSKRYYVSVIRCWRRPDGSSSISNSSCTSRCFVGREEGRDEGRDQVVAVAVAVDVDVGLDKAGAKEICGSDHPQASYEGVGGVEEDGAIKEVSEYSRYEK